MKIRETPRERAAISAKASAVHYHGEDSGNVMAAQLELLRARQESLRAVLDQMEAEAGLIEATVKAQDTAERQTYIRGLLHG